jgi:hypothetical protein
MGFLSGAGLKVIVVLALLGALAGWAGYKHLQVVKAVAQRDEAIAQRDQAGVARDKAIDAAHETEVTIGKLQQEKADIETALTNLEADKKKTAVVINNLAVAVRAGASNPANQVHLSPTLQDTITAIQKERARRESGELP